MNEEEFSVEVSDEMKKKIQEIADERDNTITDTTEYLIKRGIQAEREIHSNKKLDIPTDGEVIDSITQAKQAVSQNKMLYILHVSGLIYIIVYSLTDIPIDLSLATGIPLGIGLVVTSSIDILKIIK